MSHGKRGSEEADKAHLLYQLPIVTIHLGTVTWKGTLSRNFGDQQPGSWARPDGRGMRRHGP